MNTCRTCAHWKASLSQNHGLAVESERDALALGRCKLHDMRCLASHSCKFWNSHPKRYDD